MANLLLHCGAHAVSREHLAAAPTPSATRTWRPIPHHAYLAQVEDRLPGFGLRVVNQAHALTHDHARYFGLLEVRNGSNHPDYTWVLGLRNSHDQTLPAGLVAGSQILICDNLAFSGEVKVSRKHTVNILRDLPELVDRAIERLVLRWYNQEKRIEAYRHCRLGDHDAHDLVVRALDRGVIPASRIPSVLNEWREPRHEVFTDRTVWSLFNAFTETLKGQLHLLPRRTEALFGLCDTYAGLN